MLQAKVNEDYRFPTVRAFTGREYVKDHWRVVPDLYRDEAERHPFLELKEASKEPEAPKVLNYKQLKARAKELNLKGYARMKKSELAELIAETEKKLEA